jgi:hypothetical protein
MLANAMRASSVMILSLVNLGPLHAFRLSLRDGRRYRWFAEQVVALLRGAASTITSADRCGGRV